MSLRLEKVGAQVKRDLGEIFVREARTGIIVTITGVRMTDDLSIAKVYLSVFAPGADVAAIFEGIRDRETHYRTELAHKMRNQLRRMPEIHFFLDDTAEYVSKIEAIFKKIGPVKADPDQAS